MSNLWNRNEIVNPCINFYNNPRKSRGHYNQPLIRHDDISVFGDA